MTEAVICRVDPSSLESIHEADSAQAREDDALDLVDVQFLDDHEVAFICKRSGEGL
jgi:hypothetical protein